MEINIKSAVLFFAIITTALSAGLLYGWTISIIPGLRNISAKSYLEAMQSINRAIINPGFFSIFFGSLILLILSTYFQYVVKVDLAFWLIAGGAICYFTGTIAVTILGNVPMNDALDLVDINTLSAEELETTRLSYEGKWNQLNLVRTIFSILAFIMLLLGVLFNRT